MTPSLRTKRAALLGAVLATALPWLTACAIAVPFKTVRTVDPDTQVLVVITQGTVNTAARAEFDRQTQRVLARMAGAPGLVTYSARRELFGPGIWTVSVWQTDAARAAFYASPLHQEAIAWGGDAIESVRYRRVWLPRREAPTDWTGVLALLARADREALLKQ